MSKPKGRKAHPDLNELAFAILNEATAEEKPAEPAPEKNQAAVELGRLGGKKGGKARAEKLTPEQRRFSRSKSRVQKSPKLSTAMP